MRQQPKRMHDRFAPLLEAGAKKNRPRLAVRPPLAFEVAQVRVEDQQVGFVIELSPMSLYSSRQLDQRPH